MVKNEQIISKGVYGFSQIADFISVKNYIFMHSGESICLAIRFSNDTDYVFDSMAFVVIQLDAAGKVIARKRVEYEDMGFEPGALYASDNCIVVEKQCADFKIQICEAYSGYYKYVVRNRRVIVYYDRKKAQRLSEPATADHGTPGVTVKKKEYGKARLCVLTALLAFLIMAAFNIYYLYSLYADTLPDKNDDGKKQEQTLPAGAKNGEESLCFGVDYAEI